MIFTCKSSASVSKGRSDFQYSVSFLSQIVHAVSKTILAHMKVHLTVLLHEHNLLLFNMKEKNNYNIFDILCEHMLHEKV